MHKANILNFIFIALTIQYSIYSWSAKNTQFAKLKCFVVVLTLSNIFLKNCIIYESAEHSLIQYDHVIWYEYHLPASPTDIQFRSLSTVKFI